MHLVEQSTVDKDSSGSVSSAHLAMAHSIEHQANVGTLADRMGQMEKTLAQILDKLNQSQSLSPAT